MNHFVLTKASSLQVAGTPVELNQGLVTLQAEAGQYLRLMNIDPAANEAISLWRKGDDLQILVNGELQVVVEDFYRIEGDGGLAIQDGPFIPQGAGDQVAGSSEGLVWTVGAQDDSGAAGWLADNGWLAGGAIGAVGAAYFLSRDEDDKNEDATLQISAHAGPFSSEAIVNVYNGSGQLIGNGSINSETGQVDINLGRYRGMAVIEVVDTNGDEGDYTSEATGELTDMDTSLRAMVQVSGRGTISYSVTPLTELAAREANLPDDLSELTDNPLTSEQVAINEQIAALFGLEDLLSEVTTVLDDDYDATDGINAAELYGDILAILSGAEENLGSLSEMIDQLLNEITITDGVASLSAAGAQMLQQGLGVYEGQGNGAQLTGQTLIENMPGVANFPSVVTLNELNDDQSLTLDILSVSAGDEVVIALGDQSLNITITEAMLNSDGSASVDFPAEQLSLLDDGTQTLSMTVNGEARQTTQLSLDLTRPSVSVSLDDSLLTIDANGVVESTKVTFTFSEAVTDFSIDDISLEQGSLTGLASQDGGLTWVGIYTPDTNVEDASLLIRVSGDYTDLNGNAPDGSSDLNTETAIDTQVPEAPVLSLLSDSGTASGDLISNQGTLNLSGVESGATVEYSLDGGNTWNTEFSAVEGENSVQARQIDAAGNTSAASESLTFTLDTSAAAPTVALSTDSGRSTSDQISNDGSLAVTATETGATLEYSIDGEESWSDSFTAVEGDNSVQVRQTDLAGNTSAASESLAFTLDTIAPATPVISLSSDTGSSSRDRISKTDRLTLTGIEANAIVEYSIDGGDNWSTEFDAVEGVNSVQVRQTDVAGNISAASNTLTFTLDTTVPTAPTLTLTTDSGSSTSDKLTNDGTLTTTGAETGATVQYSTDNGSTWSSSFTAVEGENSVQVRQTDVAGNTSASRAITFTLDTQAPEPEEETSKNTDTVQLEAPAAIGNDGPQVQITTIGSEGEYVVVWHGTDSDEDVSIFVQPFNADGTANGSPLQLRAPGVDEARNYSAKVTAIGTEGAYAVTWYGNDSDGDESIFVQVVDAEGTPADPVKLEIIGVTDARDANPQITEVGTEGSFVVTWRGEDETNSYVINSQAFSASGSTLGERVELQGVQAAGYFYPEYSPTISAIGSDGSYAVATPDVNGMLHVQAYQLDGTPIGPKVTLSEPHLEMTSDFSDLKLIAPQIVSVGSDGAYVVTWHQKATYNDPVEWGRGYAVSTVMVQAFNSDGTTKGETVNLGYRLDIDYLHPQIASVGSEGAYVVVTNGYTIDSNSNYTYGVLVQAFNADGSTNGEGVVLPGSYSTRRPQITAIGSEGAYVVTWQGSEMEYDNNISIQAFHANGEPNGSTIVLDAVNTTGSQVGAQVTAVGTESDFVVTWIAEDSDGDRSVFVKLFLATSLTNNPLYDVTLADDAASWEYSIQDADFVAGDSSNQISLTDGTYEAGDIVIRQYDLAGNMTETSNGNALVVDTIAEAPVISLTNDTGASTEDLITNDGTLSLSGVEEGATVEYRTYNQNTESWSEWSENFTAVEGENSVQVRQIDAAGNTSDASDTFTFTLDSTAPETLSVALTNDTSAPEVTGLKVPINNTEEDTGDLLTSDAALTLTGQEDGAIIQYSVVDDQWGTEFEAVEGLNTVKVRQVDAAGNESDVTEFTFTLDTSKPTAPNGSLEDDLGASQTDGITSNGTILFGDASEDNLVYKYSLDGGDNWTVTTRNYVNLDEGTYAKGNIKVIAIDEAGNESDAYEHPIEVVVDRAAPELTSIQLGDTALKSGETTTVTFTFSEAVTDFDLNAISSGNGTLSGLNSDDGITWTATLTPLENTEANTNQISVGTSYKDIAGNAPTDSAQSDNFSVDTQLPSVNRIFIYGGRLGTGDTASVEFEFSEYMDESSITLEDFSATHGTLSNLNVTRGEGATIATMTYTPNANIQDVSGVISIGTDVQDLAGNSLVAQKDSDSIDIDTLAPNAPGIELLTDTGSSTGDLITSDGTLSLSGVEVGATVEYRTYDQGTESWSEWTDWSTAFTAVEGENSIQVRQTDSSDNVSDASDTFTFTLDTQAPEPEVEASKNTDTVKVEWQEPGYTLNNDLQPQITAIGSDGAYVVVWEDYDELGTGKTYIDLQIFNADGSKTDTSWFLSGEKPYNFSPKVTAIGAEGAFALTWFGWDSYGDLSVHVQFVDAEGTLADQVKLEAIGVTNGNDTHPQITEVGTDGSFVVTWVGDSTITTLEDIYAVYSQAFDASGSKSGEITQLAGITVDGISDSNDAYESVPAITAIGTEGAYAIAVVDSNNQIKVQAYELNGTPIGSTTTISVALAEDAHSPQIIALGDEGAYAVIWSKSWMVSTGTPLGSYPSSDVVIQRFNPDGSPNGGQEYVSQWMTTLTPNARIAAIGDEGAYVIVSSGQNHIEVKTFNADGSQSVADFSQDIASGNTGNAYPQVAEIGSDGAFVAIWSGSEESATDTISVQTFNSDGTPSGSTVTIFAPGVDNDDSVAPQVTAVGTDGDFVVTWSGDDTDGDQSVFVKLFVPDSITNNPLYDVTLADDAASWEYSIQGADFVAGDSSNQISLTDGTYEAGDIVIRQYDLAGNMTETSNGGALVVDTTAPTVTLFTGEQGVESVEAGYTGLYVNSTEAGTVYFVNTDVTVTDLDSITNADDDQWNAVENVEAGTYHSLDTTGLAAGTYTLYAVDEVGNLSQVSEDSIEVTAPPMNILFDLVEGYSTLDSDLDREFDTDTTYNIYMLVDSDSTALSLSSSQRWSGADNLGADDRIILVGNDGAVQGEQGVSMIMYMPGQGSYDTNGIYIPGPMIKQTVYSATVMSFAADNSGTSWMTGSANYTQGQAFEIENNLLTRYMDDDDSNSVLWLSDMGETASSDVVFASDDYPNTGVVLTDIYAESFDTSIYLYNPDV